MEARKRIAIFSAIAAYLAASRRPRDRVIKGERIDPWRLAAKLDLMEEINREMEAI